jgi:hypothetical protein
MSALGHKQTFALQQVMSALPPKATLDAFFLDVRYGQYRTHAAQQKRSLFDHSVCAGEQRRRYRQAERLGGF